MQFSLFEIQQIVYNTAGLAISQITPVTLDKANLLIINPSNQTLFFGTFSGLFGENTVLKTNAFGTTYKFGFDGTSEASSGTNMGVGSMCFPNIMFTEIEEITSTGNQIVFSGYRFDLLDCSEQAKAKK